MRKKILAVICTSLCLVLAACGAKEEQVASDNGGKKLAALDETVAPVEEVVEEVEEAEPEVVEAVEEEIDFGDVAVGATVTLGVYNDQPIEWQVLDVQEGKALVITKNCVTKGRYAEKNAEGITWEDSVMRGYLNGEFYEAAFSNAEKAKIVTTTVINSDNPKYATAGGNDTEDAIFLLSLDEAERYFDSDDSRVVLLGDKEYDWWLRSPGMDEKRAACVIYDGSIRESGGTFIDGNGIRPACWINIQ